MWTLRIRGVSPSHYKQVSKWWYYQKITIRKQLCSPISELHTCSKDVLGSKQHIITGIYRAIRLSTDKSTLAWHGTNILITDWPRLWSKLFSWECCANASMRKTCNPHKAPNSWSQLYPRGPKHPRKSSLLVSFLTKINLWMGLHFSWQIQGTVHHWKTSRPELKQLVTSHPRLRAERKRFIHVAAYMRPALSQSLPP